MKVHFKTLSVKMYIVQLHVYYDSTDNSAIIVFNLDLMIFRLFKQCT